MPRFNALTTAASRELARFCGDESGATAIEYAMVASGVGVAVATMIYALGSKVTGLFTGLSGKMS